VQISCIMANLRRDTLPQHLDPGATPTHRMPTFSIFFVGLAFERVAVELNRMASVSGQASSSAC